MGEHRTGFGFDAHRFGGTGPIILGGVEIDHDQGVDATSDGDLVAHALCDALLGAAVLGDIGKFYPSSDPASADADSMEMLSDIAARCADAGFRVVHVDMTIVVQAVRIAPHVGAMRANLAARLQLDVDAVSVKATTTDHLGWIGAGEGLGVAAVATVTRVRSDETAL